MALWWDVFRHFCSVYTDSSFAWTWLNVTFSTTCSYGGWWRSRTCMFGIFKIAGYTVVSLHFQVLQGNTRGHSGVWRHQRRVFRQRQTVVAWNQSELRRRVSNIRWASLPSWAPVTFVLSTVRNSPVMQIVGVCLFFFQLAVGNKNDDPNSKVVETTDAQKFAEQMGINLFETSAKENINVEEVSKNNQTCTCQINRRLLLASPQWPHVVVFACRCSTASQSWC